jgi:hypothetical protein
MADEPINVEKQESIAPEPAAAQESVAADPTSTQESLAPEPAAAQESLGTEPAAALEQDPVLELNFVPEWARKPPAEKYREFSEDERSSRDRHGAHGRPFDRNRERPGQDRGRPRKPGFSNRREQGGDSRGRRIPRETAPIVRVNVHIIPERRQLAALVRQIHSSRKSYQVMQLASLLLSNPQFCLIKIEPAHTGTNASLFQCKACRMVVTDKATMAGHILKAHIGDYFEKTEVVAEPPSGQFTCVARCRLSGIVLGPPNHHSYTDKVKEIHRARFSDMSLEDYRNRIEVLHDQQLVDQWKEEFRKQTVYRLKGAPAENVPLKWGEAEAYMLKEVVPALTIETARAISPADLALKSDDRQIAWAVRDAWEKETHFPLSLSLALRGAFHHMDLHLFKAGRGVHFATAIPPLPLDPEHTVDTIREVLTFLHGHPGCTRSELVGALCKDLPPDSPDKAKVLSPLTWLIEKGHIIEFYNSTLAVPLGLPAGKPAAKPEAK